MLQTYDTGSSFSPFYFLFRPKNYSQKQLAPRAHDGPGEEHITIIFHWRPVSQGAYIQGFLFHNPMSSSVWSAHWLQDKRWKLWSVWGHRLSALPSPHNDRTEVVAETWAGDESKPRQSKQEQDLGSLAAYTAERVPCISCLWATSLGLPQVPESSLPQGGTLSPERSYANCLKALCFFWLSSQRTSLWPSINLLQRHFSFQMLWSGMIPK